MEGNQAASEKKRYLKTHSALTTELSEAMLKGELHKFNNTAEEMLYEKKFDNDTIKGLVKGKNSVEARVRLALLHRLLIDEDDSVYLIYIFHFLPKKSNRVQQNSQKTLRQI